MIKTGTEAHAVSGTTDPMATQSRRTRSAVSAAPSQLTPSDHFKKERQRLYSVFDQAPAMIAIGRGPDLVFEYANPLYLRVLGKDRSIIGKKLLDVFPEIQNQPILGILRNVYNQGKPFVGNETHMRLRGDDGKLKDAYFNFVYQPYQDDAGEVDSIMTHAVDVTGQVEARRRIEESEERFRAMLERSEDVIQLVTPEGRILYMSESVKKVLGYTPAELEGVAIAPYIHPEDMSAFERRWKKLLADPKKPVTLEYRAMHKSGAWVLLETALTNHLETPGIRAILGNFRDITRRKRTEQSLQAQRVLVETITDNATLGLLMMNENQFCTFLNPAAERLIGYTMPEIKRLKMPLHEIIHYKRPDGREYPMHECPIDSALPQKKRMQGEDAFIRPDGSFYSVAFTASPITKDGKPVGTVVEVRDTTEEKAVRKEHERLALIESQRNELLKLNKAKDEFIALASHQLRTPATAVKQYIALVLEEYVGTINDDQKQILQTAYENNERQLTVITDLLKTAQIDSAAYGLHKKLTDIAILLSGVIADMRSVLSLKSQRAVLRGGKRPVIAKVDAAEMKLVFTNLLENASKYSYSGSDIIVTIQQNATFIKVAFTDSGVGVEDEDFERIFEKFTRVDNELSDTVTGSGLGLYWVKQIIELHGGNVAVTSKPGRGSTFSVEFPV